MNLARVLEVALPDTPPLRVRKGFPRMHPRHVAREHNEREGPLVMVLVPDGPNCFFRFNPYQYKLATKFDGERSYEQVASAFREETGIALDPANVREFAESLEKIDFWYKTPQEQSVQFCEQLVDQRRKKIKRKRDFGDLSVIELIYFDPDRYLTWIHNKLSFIYTPWFTAWSFFMLIVALTILGARWGEFWADSVKFYNFTEKSLVDVVEFFAIFFLLGAFHETAHGMTCKHFGGESHRMGIFMIYLVPGVFCEVQEVYVYGDRRARMLTVAAGVWSEILLCQYFTLIWWITPPGSWVHGFCYKLILSGGIFCVLINWNPLAKMDGYYLFCELFRFWDLKGLSSTFLAAWVRKNVFRMPATVPALPPLRQVGFAVYAMLSGVYCYSLMLFFVKILYRIAHHFSPQWAFVPATLLALGIFRSRIRKLGQFMKELHLDKKEWLQQHRTPILATGFAILLLLVVPLRREYVEEPFMIEPAERAVVRAEVAGAVAEVYVDEGQRLQAGAPIARLRDLNLETKEGESSTGLQLASSRAHAAQLSYRDFGQAEQERLRMVKTNSMTQDQVRKLRITSPIDGVVVTARVKDLLGAYLKPGSVIAEVANLESMRARVYVSETELHKLQAVHDASLRVNSRWKPLEGKFLSISPAAAEVEPGLIAAEEYTGLHRPKYFALDLAIPDSRTALSYGMTGTAKIFGERRSLGGAALRPLFEALARRVW
jgi:putative peptide zinc metalloprotease protein